MTRTDKAKSDAKPPCMIAWHVTEGRERNFWTRIGAAWQHEDGEGLTLSLDLLPVSGGRIVLRAPKENDKAEDGGKPA